MTNKNTMKIMRCILMACMIMAFIPNALSETGIVPISDITQKTYAFGSIGGGAGINFTQIRYDSTNINDIERFYVQYPGITFGRSFEYTTFTLSNGASGGGYAWYDRNTSMINMEFTADNVYTSSPFRIIYNKNIFLNLTGFGNVIANSEPTVPNPVCFGAVGGACYGGGTYYNVNTGVSQDDTYETTYFSNFVRVSINKGVSVDSLYRIETLAGANYSVENPPFNKVDIDNATFQYGAGLAVNATLANGAYARVVINTSGVTSAPDVRTYPATGANVYTDKADYVVGENIDVEWFIADDPYDNFATRCRFLINDDAIQSDVHQHANYTVLLPATGTYKLDIACGIIYYSVVGSRTVHVISEGQSYISIPINSTSGGKQNISFRYGFPSGLYAANSIAIFYLDGGDWVQENTYYATSFCGGACGALTIYSANVTFLKEGYYRLDLRAHGRGVVATSTTTAAFITKTCTTCFDEPLVTTSKSIYFMREGADVYYQVDSANYSAYKLYIELYNYNKSVVSEKRFIDTESATRLFYITDKKQLSGEFLSFPGNNAWQIRAYHPSNDTLKAIIAYKNITITNTNTGGYAISVSKDPICNKNDFADINIIAPSSTTVLFYEPGGKTVALNLSESRSIHWSGVRPIGYYGIQVLNPSGIMEVQSSVNVISCSAAALPPITGQPGFTGNPMEEVTNKYLSTTMVPFILLIVFAVVGQIIGGTMGAVIGFGAGFIFLAAFGFIPTWALFLFAILVITAFASMLSNRVTGGN